MWLAQGYIEVKHLTPRAGYNLKNLGRSPLGEATPNIKVLKFVVCVFKVFILKSFLNHVN